MKKKKIFSGIFFKYVITFITVILVCFAVLSFIIGIMVKNYLTESKQNEVNHLADAGKSIISYDFYTSSFKSFKLYCENNYSHVQKLVSDLTGDSEIFILLCYTNNEVSVTDDGVCFSGSSRVSEEFTDIIDKDEKYSTVTKAGIFSREHYMSGVILYDENDNHIGYLFACIPMSCVNEPVMSTIQTIIVVCMWIMLAAVIASYFVSDRIVRPLKNLSVAAKAFASGDFSVRVPVDSNDEISDFIKIFNGMASELETLENTRSIFIANVSHDLRSPMTTIAGFVDGILDGAIPYEEQSHYLDIVKNEIQRLSRLVTTLLDMSRIEAGERKFVMKDFDICEMGRQILISFEKRINDKGLDVSFECDEDRMIVNADSDAIYQVFYNLCDNAIKFSYEKGRLAVSIREREKSIYVYVYNEGKGIGEPDISHVFDRFYKADRSRGMDKMGTGLGLYISKTIINAHGQTIKVESKSGKYCEFMFTLKKV